MKSLPWLRLYTEIIDDEKLGLLAFEDRWHFVALLCLKGKGVLDNEPDAEMLRRKIALKMGLTCAELEKVASRLSRMGLIDFDTFQPCAWNERQMQSDTSTERTKAYRERMKRHSDVTVTAQELDTEKDTDTEKEAEKKTRAKALSQPESVSAEVWSDFLSLRKDKRAKLTATALAGIQAEADKAGYTLEKALSTCCARGWQSFNADWISGKPGQSHAAAPINKQEALEARNREVARKWAAGE
jgi:Skp family chaperone for outer membrane proteins